MDMRRIGWSLILLFVGLGMSVTSMAQVADDEAGVQVIEQPQEQGDLQKAFAASFTLRPEERDFDDAYLDQLELPEGFRISVFARDLENPRIIRVAPGGQAYVAERNASRVRMLQDTSGDGMADVSRVVASGLNQVHGLAVHDGWLYMVGIHDLWRARISEDGSLAEPEHLLDDLPNAGQHPNRTIDVGPDEMMYLSIGSTTNANEEQEPEMATIMRGQLDGTGLAIYAEGLRNTIGFDWHPTSGQLWGMDHGSDMRGNDIPPEELNRIEQDRHYGWPFCYGEREVDFVLSADPEDQTKQEFCAGTEPMTLGYTPHAAPMQMVFYRGEAFPDPYRSSAFVAMRGSWNRSPAVGYEIARVEFDNTGRPAGIQPFAGSWLLDEGRAHFGRLVGLAEAIDGSLLVTDDANGIVYRIAYVGN